MKLSQLYANKNFKKIVFNDGLNLVVARVTKALDAGKDSHCLGKTTLIEVLDFMLLSRNEKENLFAKHKNKFSNYEFYLEILLNTGKYLTIKRTVQNANKIAFKQTDVKSDLINNQKWDHAAVAFDQAKKLLNEYLSFDVLTTDWTYRKSVSYFLRSQKDYSDVCQLDKFKGKHKDWKPFVFNLLGFNSRLLKEKYEEEERLGKLNTDIQNAKKDFSVDPKDIDKIRGAIYLKNEEKRELQEKVDRFNFYQQERNLNRELVEDIEQRIAVLNTSEYNLNYTLEKTRQSLSQNMTFDIEQLKQLYEEAGIYFTEQIVKDYKALENFNRKITAERNKYLHEKIESLSNELIKVRASLFEYDQKRSDVLSVLQDKDSFRKFKTFQGELSKIEGELLRLEDKLKGVDKITGYMNDKSDVQRNLETITKKIKTQILKGNEIYSDIRKLYGNIFKCIVNTPVIVFIEQNKLGNIEFRTDVTQDNEIDITAEGQGNTYRKMLCVTFDLSVLGAYSRRSFYRFVYHDGVYEGLDNRIKTNFIELVRRFCSEYNIQYIFSAIEHDIPPNMLAGFSEEEICLKLDDSGDNGKLFEFSF